MANDSRNTTRRRSPRRESGAPRRASSRTTRTGARPASDRERLSIRYVNRETAAGRANQVDASAEAKATEARFARAAEEYVARHSAKDTVEAPPAEAAAPVAAPELPRETEASGGMSEYPRKAAPEFAENSVPAFERKAAPKFEEEAVSAFGEEVSPAFEEESAPELGREAAPEGAAPVSRGDASVPLDVLALPYASFMCFTLRDDSVSNINIIKDELKLFGWPKNQTYASMVDEFCQNHVAENWREDYRQRFSTEALAGAMGGGSHLISLTFSSEKGRLHQDTYVFIGDAEDITLFVGIQAENEDSNALVLREAGNSVSNAVADMQIEMQFERKEMKSHTRRIAIFFTLIALLLGCVGGAFLDRQGGVFTNVLNQFFPKEEVAETIEDTESTEPEATAEPVVPIYIARESSADITAEISSNGTARTYASTSDTYDTGTFKVTVTEVLGPDDFESSYGKKYTLDGTEACVGLEVDFSALADKDLDVVPQDAFLISMTGDDGETVEEYQLMDKEIGGTYGASVSDGSKKTFYKRYKYSEDIDYLVLSSFQDGTRSDYYFALRYDDPNVTHVELKQGDKSTLVYYLKAKLAELGYFSGTVDKSYNSATVTAVKAAQADFGLEETGVADSDFQNLLYSK